MKVFIFYFCLMTSIINCDINILVNKTFSVSNKPADAVKINDGNYQSCITFDNTNVNWAVVNLKAIAQINKVVITVKKALGKEPISVLVGDNYQPCKFHRQLSGYRVCKASIIMTAVRTEIICDTPTTSGQYLVVIKGNFSSGQNAETLNICELEAYGNVVKTVSDIVRPVIASQSLDPVTANDFTIAKEIRRDVTTVRIPVWSQSFSYVSGLCQPLIWDQTSLRVFSIACQTADGKGRLVAFGKSYYFNGIVTDSKTTVLKQNLMKWLSPNNINSKIIKKTDIKTLADLRKKVKAGDILDFNVPVAYAADVLSAISSMILNGTLSVNIDFTLFSGCPIEAQLSYQQILGIFNIDFNANYLTWGSTKDFSWSDSDFNDSILSVEDQIYRMTKNHDFLIKRGSNFGAMFSSIPNSILLRSKVKQYLQELIVKYDPLLQFICPCKVAPAIDTADRSVLDLFTQLMESQLLVNSNYKFPCIDLYPGDFETSPMTNTVTLTVIGQTESTDNPIGYYLAAGSTATYTVQKSDGSWAISIGCHTDHLTDNRPEWYRYPDIYVDRVPLQTSGEIYSAFGGPLWLYNRNINQSITITLSNVVATPFFNLRGKSPEVEWDNQRNNPGLWAQIAGDNLVICEQSKLVKGFTGAYLKDLMQNNWDKLVKMDFSIKSVNWRTQRPVKVVLDIMVGFGYGHSGYPIVVWDDWFLSIFNRTLIFTEGSWGMCHEVGHNMQESTWTFSAVTEVTNNLLCLYNHDKLWNVPRFGSDVSVLRGNLDNIVKHLNGSPTYKSWSSSPWIALSIYAQMANNLGWGFYRDVFAYYQTNIPSLANDNDEIAMWINVTCKVSKQNLVPLFDFWGVTINDAVAKEVSVLPCFFPNDFFTQLSSTRSSYIMQKYGNCNRVAQSYQDYDPAADIVGVRQNFIQELSVTNMAKVS